MNKKQFAFIFTGIIVLIILSFILQTIFSDQTDSFGISGGAFFVSTFCLVEYKNALKPKDPFTINMTKRYYEKIGDLQKYRTLCKNLLIATISIGTISLLLGLFKISINYFISVFAH